MQLKLNPIIIHKKNKRIFAALNNKKNKQTKKLNMWKCGIKKLKNFNRIKIKLNEQKIL